MRGIGLFLSNDIAHTGEKSELPGVDTYLLSSMRAMAVMKALSSKGVSSKRMTVVSYGDTRPVKVQGQSKGENNNLSRRVEIMIRKRDLESTGRKVDAY